MGNLPKYCCCTINNNGNNINQNQNNENKIPPKTSINLFDYDPKEYSKEENRIKNKNNKDISLDDSSISDYEYLTPEEMKEINEKLNLKFQKYKQIPLKTSDINIIYKSGVIE